MSIRLFDKTPLGIVCPHFWILNWARGCPYRCSYCYLALTHRFHGNEPYFYPWSKIEKFIDKFMDEHKEPAVLNTGELADSLMNPTRMKLICDKFVGQDRHKVLLLTKGVHTDFLHRGGYQDVAIVSFSVNADFVAESFEKGTSPPVSRLFAAWQLRNSCYETRIRIDPIVPVRAWRSRYERLIRLMMEMGGEYHTRITLGTPRWFPALPYWLRQAGRSDDFFKQFENNKELCCDGRYRLKNRVEIYEFLISTLRKYGYKRPIALCKETVDTWLAVCENTKHVPVYPLEQGKILCNCTL